MIEHHLYAFKADCVWELIVSRHTVCSKSLWSLRTTHKLSTIETRKKAQLVDEHSTGLTDVQNPGSTSITRKRVQN